MANEVSPKIESKTDHSVQTVAVRVLPYAFITTILNTRGAIPKVIQVVCNFLGFLCVQCTISRELPTGKWFSTISIFGLFISGILLLLSIAKTTENCFKYTWFKFELFYYSIMGVSFLIASCMVASMGLRAFQAAAFFGFSSTLAYVFSARFCYVAIKAENVKKFKTIKPEPIEDTSKDVMETPKPPVIIVTDV